MAVKKTISFADLDGNSVSEDWYFSLGKTDVLDMDLVHHEDVAAYLTQIMKDRDSRKLLEVWRELLFRSVAKREGKMLVKDESVLREFRYGGAFEQFFSEIIESEDAGAQFFMSIMPADIQEQITTEQNKVFTTEDLLAMSDSEFAAVAGTDEKEMSREHLLIAFQRKTAKAA